MSSELPDPGPASKVLFGAGLAAAAIGKVARDRDRTTGDRDSSPALEEP